MEYKKIAEKEIQKHFEFPLTKTRCTVKSKLGVDNREGLFTNNYLIEENDTESFIWITLEYSIFSTEINDWFPILMTIDSNKVIDYRKTNFSIIPSCLLKNQGCNFIKSDRAALIAIKDSILYPDNLKTFFWVDEKSGKCFWTVKGYLKTKSITGSKNQYRKIDALTGEIIK
ncbi:MAG: hypothetical protein WKF88_04765 [Ferruginibacter sp.]